MYYQQQNLLTIKNLILILCVLSLNCKGDSEKKTIAEEVTNDIAEIIETKIVVDASVLDSLKLNINFKPNGIYTSITNKIQVDKDYFKSLYNTNPTKAIDSASQYIYSKLINGIVPHWYGTEWDFNGYTNIPNKGEIACGYFVSTTLKHLGFNLNRYKMAQAAGLDEAQLLQPRSDLKIFSNVSFEQLRAKVNSVYADGIYFVGLDNHVGYVLVSNNVLYFLHSSYCDYRVVIEPAETSPCFSSNLYVFAEITTNKKLIKSWIFNERLQI